MITASALIDGRLVPATGDNPAQIRRSDIEGALAAGQKAFDALVDRDPRDIAGFLDTLAALIDRDALPLAELAHSETALPVEPRLIGVEIPRTTDQLRQAAQAVRDRSWIDLTVSREANVVRTRVPLPGVVFVLGPNNFPFAFNAIGGGDFAAAIGTRHPVLAKANPGHPATTIELARLALEALDETGLPSATVQMLVDVDPDDGLRLVGDHRVAATAFTGSRAAGLALKTAADAAGKPIYLEMSAINPLVVLEAACANRGAAVAAELAGSITMGSGQFCTKPGLAFVPESHHHQFVADLAASLAEQPVHPLLGEGTLGQLREAVSTLRGNGAETLLEVPVDGEPPLFPTTVLGVTSQQFKESPGQFLGEAFGNVTVLISWQDHEDLLECLADLHGTLAASIYFDGDDEAVADKVVAAMSAKAGRLVANKPPTGVQVVPAMNHGGPYPATGHAGFTAVGIPESFKRFTMLLAYDNFPDHMLPLELRTGE